MARVLIVEDEKAALEALEKALKKSGYDTELAESGEKALKIYEQIQIDVVLLDIRMGGIDGMEVLTRMCAVEGAPPVIMMTAHGDVPTAVEAMKKGAFNFLQKPLDLEHLRVSIKQALEYRELGLENSRLKKELSDKYSFENIIGSTSVMRELFQMIAQVAPTEASILVTGENGTGKELVANAIHANSPRAGKPLIKLHCAALSETLLESELFGHVKGAFTGADRERQGYFEAADGGTLFLDEIGDITQATQVKLLRFLQEREFSPVGSNVTVKVDVRIIAATNKDLEKSIQEGSFREDLYFRLNVVNLCLPSLKDRIDDIPILVEHFLAKYSARNNRVFKGISPEFMDTLSGYSWPGNIRELENVMERAVILSQGDTIEADVLPLNIKKTRTPGSFAQFPRDATLKEMERSLILKTLEKEDGNKTRTAKVLGIGTKTLYRKLDEYGAKGNSKKL